SNTYEEVGIEDDEEEGLHHELSRQEVVLYHLETGKQEKMKFPEEIALDFNVDSLIEDMIYLTKESEDEFHVIGYNIESKEIETDYTIDLNQGTNGERITVYLQDNFISIVDPLKSNVVDAIIK